MTAKARSDTFAPLDIPLSADPLTGHIGNLTLLPDLVIRAVVAWYRIGLGVPRGRATEWDSEDANRLLAQVRPLVDKLLPNLPSRVNAWMRSVLFDDLLLDQADAETVVRVLELSGSEQRLTLLTLPSVQRAIAAARSTGPESRKRVQKILAGIAAGKRGRPRTSEPKRADVRLALLVAENEARLLKGVEFTRKRRKRGGYLSDSDVIRAGLADMGYDSHEVRAILGSRTLGGAAKRLVTSRAGKNIKIDSLRATVSRGLKHSR